MESPQAPIESEAPTRVVCAMSGGVDSSVAAALLKDAGHEVVGLFMRNGIKPGQAASRGKQGCCSLDDAQDARRVASLLDIPFYAVDFSDDFQTIIENFEQEYDRGRTPNPCIRCNKQLKFGRLLDYADEVGATHVATGHYGRVVQKGQRLAVRRPEDASKDQSYVLFPLDQQQLSRTLLPLGDMMKTEVRAMATQIGLPVDDKPDSQEICFVPDNDYAAMLARRNPGKLREGDLVDLTGQVVGRHPGHQHFTIGQRKGLGGGSASPRYVVAIDAPNNRVIVGERSSLLSQGLLLSELTFSGAAEAELRDGPIRGEIQIRYQHQPMSAEARLEEDGQVHVVFDNPLASVTPGQAAVFYQQDVIALGGFIEAPLAMDAHPLGSAS